MSSSSFQDTGLDPRILRALSKQGFTSPTPVQAAAIPAALQGKDIVARARTGSGKTLSYLLPALQRIVVGGNSGGSGGSGGSSVNSSSRAPWQVVVLVPTRELCEQVASEGRAIAKHCGVPISITALLGDTPVAQRAAAAAAGALVVTTPARMSAALREAWVQPQQLAKTLQMLVLDEADLLLSYGYNEDLQALAVHIPRSAQCILMSATASPELEQLQQLILHNPVTLNLLRVTHSGPTSQQPPSAAAAGDGGDAAAGGGGGLLSAGGAGSASEILHYALDCAGGDRRLVVLGLLKLGLLRKKVLIFTNSVDEGVGLRLFLESFGLRLGCLHAQLPVNSRSHILAAFNKGLFDYLIAVDDVHARSTPPAAAAAGGGSKAAVGQKRKRKQRAAAAADDDDQGAGSKKKGGGGNSSSSSKKDEEFGVTRGIDFKGVRSVINYDLPDSLEGYVHRVGRTGRGGMSGLALTLFTPGDVSFRQSLSSALLPVTLSAAATANDDVLARQQHQQQQEDGSGSESESESEEEEELGGGGKRQKGGVQQGGLRPFTRLTPSSLEALRYRAEDVGRTITKGAVREARARELQRELLNSEKLTEYFEEHEAERLLLKHDKPMHRKGGHIPHLKHLPAYLRLDPAAANPNDVAAAGAAAVAAAQRQPRQKGPKAKRHKSGGADPLKAAAAATGGTAGAGGAAGAAGVAAGGAGGGVSGKGTNPTPAAAAAVGAGVGGGGSVFVKPAKRSGAAADEEMTDLEKRALAKPLKPSKGQVLQGVGGAALQAKVLGRKVAEAMQGLGPGGGNSSQKRGNVRAVRPTMGVGGAKRRR